MADGTLGSRSGKLPSWFGIPFLLGGVVFLGVGVVLLQDELRFGSEGVSAAGTVLDTIYHPGGGEDGPTYSIRYEFVDSATGTRQAGESDVSEEAFDAASAGDPIEVTYLPAQPTKSRVGSPEPQLFVPAIMFGAALLFIVVGAGFLIAMRWMRSNGGSGAMWMGIGSGVDDDDDDLDEGASAMVLGMLGMGDLAAAARATPMPDGSAAYVEPTEGTPPEPHQPTTEAELRALDARLAPPTEPS